MKSAALLLLAAALLPAQVKLPSYTRDVLPNGAVVYLVPKTGLPLVSFRVVVRGGAESDPANLPGLSGLTAELLRRGTAKRTADQFAEEIDSLGGVFGSGADEQSTVVNAEFLQKDFARGLDLLADAVLHPSFPEAEVNKSVARAVDRVRSLKDNPGAAIQNYFRPFFFGAAHPYGRVPDEKSLARIRRDDIAGHHRRMYAGRNLIVIVAGDFDSVSAKPAVASAFGAAPAGTAYNWAEDNPPVRGEKPRLLLVDKPDATQTYFAIAQPGIRRNSPDRVPLILINTLFGGRFTSMLNDALRVNSGLTYGAGSMVNQHRMTGGIVINTYTKTETTAPAIDLALQVLGRLHNEGVTAEQLASAKAYVKGTFPSQRLETSDQIAAVIGDLELFALGRDDIDGFFARIDAVTPEQANAIARRYYRPQNLVFVLLGNAAKVREAASKYSPSIVERSIATPGWI